MKDLIFALDEYASAKARRLVIETYFCENKYNAKWIYKGGFIQSVNILYENRCDNFSNGEFEEIKSQFANNAEHIYKNGYMFSYENFIAFFNKYCLNHNFYFRSKSGFISMILSVQEEEKSEKSISKCSIIECGKNTYVFNQKKNVLIASIEEDDSVTEIKPSIRIVFNSNDLTLCKLKFIYGEYETDYFNKENNLDVKAGLYRNYEFENQIYDYLLQIGFKKEFDVLRYVQKLTYDELTALLNRKGYEVLTYNFNNEREIQKPNISIQQSDKDWFEIKFEYKLDDEVIDIASAIDFTSKNKSIIVGNSMLTELPDSVFANRKKFEVRNGHIYLNKKNLWSILDIASESGINIDGFIDHSKVSLNLPKDIQRQAKKYQLNGIKWLKWCFINGFGGCLADDMGLGKTFQIIALLKDKDVESKLDKVLIVVPKTLITNWRRELKKFGNIENICIYHGYTRSEEKLKHSHIAITTYHIAMNDIKILKQFYFTVVIFDEIQTIKNPKGIISQKLKKLNSYVNYGLSGTPMENKMEELWNILDVINPSMLNSRRAFCKRYKNNIRQLRNVIRPFVLRRCKKDVLTELPEKNQEIIYCDFDNAQRKLYEAILLAVRNNANNIGFTTSLLLKALLNLRQCCCDTRLLPKEINVNDIKESCKIKNLQILVSNLVEADHKVLIFSQFTSMLKLIQESLIENYKYVFYLDGETVNRQMVVDFFEASPRGIFLISLKAGGVGLNLTSAQDVIIFDPWWNPFAEEQAIDRAYRIGQRNDVTVYKLVVSDSIEEKIINLQLEKKKTFDDILNGLDNFYEIKLKDIYDILMKD
ncbi:DEAD/DEAH box helicase [Clostridium tyrobutyricum]|uniref:DEAD/DEAH box helicase n=1 Tax=Clostridium tyrobutyricum TaxID=1519 RepID=UPI002B1F58F1|nr:DEAD/DEAH box helicase [Clostridium tyrobutyricum]MEA5009345.1 DEAD/DEAH box helicase [Clostridium tyrobutyricum]